MVKDLKYILKRILIGVGIALALMFLKGGLIADVNAATTGYILYNSNYGVIAQNSVTTNQNFNYQSVYRIRLNFDNSIVQNHTYLATITIDLTRVDNVSPTYPARAVFVGGQEQTSESSIVESYVEQQGAVSYYRHLVLNYTFKANNSSSINNFFEAQLSSSAHITYLNANVTITDIDDGTSSAVNNAANQIINNNNSNTQNIINNQNENTEKEIESQKVCQQYGINDIGTDNSYLNYSTGTTGTNSNYAVSKYINIYNSTLSVVNPLSLNQALSFYNKDKGFISSTYTNTAGELTIPDNAYYVRFTIYKANSKPIIEVCKNGNQAVNDAIGNLNNNITDSSYDDIGGDIQGIQDIGADFTTNTPISDLLLMPFTLLNAYSDGISSTCQPISLGSLYGTNLTLPCIDIEDYLGSNLWGIIDTLICIFLTYNIGMFAVQIYDQLTSLHDGFDSLYVPKHVDTYKPKHGGDN